MSDDAETRRDSDTEERETFGKHGTMYSRGTNSARMVNARQRILLILLIHPVVLADERSSLIDALKLESGKAGDAIVHYEPCLEEELTFFEGAYSAFRNGAAEYTRPLKTKKEAILQEIDALVGAVGEPDGVYDNVVGSLTEMASSVVAAAPTFYLVRQPTIKDYLRKGGRLPDFSYDREADTAHYKWSFRTSDRADKKSELVFPVGSVETFQTDVKKTFQMISAMQETLTTVIAIHEIAELSLFRRLKTGTPRIRWFSDGFANVITHEVLREHFSQRQAKELLNSYDVEPYSDIRDQVNLRYWMIVNYNVGSPSNPFPLEAERRLEHARYSYAFDEARRLVGKHGIECLKRIVDLFAARTGGFHVLRDESINDLYEGIQEVTGEDLRERFLRYQRFASEEEGMNTYRERFHRAEGENNREQMVLNLLRQMELCESPFLPESQEIRRQIAVLLSDLGHGDFADRAMHRWAAELENMGKLSGIGPTRLFEIMGKAIFMTYALEARRPHVAVDYADEILEIEPSKYGFSVPAGIHRAGLLVATTVKMHHARQNGDTAKAIELAKEICKLAEGDISAFYNVDLCHRMAREFLSETE